MQTTRSGRPTRSILLSTLVVTAVSMALWMSSSEANDPVELESEVQPNTEHVSQASSSYSIHEWGLVRFDEVSEIATSGFGTPSPSDPIPGPDEPVLTRKPVIYFHPGPDFDPATRIDVTITIDGTLREVWPTPNGAAQPLLGPSFTWSQVAVRPNLWCGRELAPTPTDPACMSLLDGGVCEAFELSLYVSAVPNCLNVGDPPIQSPVLLYNGYINFDAPVALAIGESERALLNMSDYPVGPMWVSIEGGLLAVDALAPGDTVMLDGQTPTSPPCEAGRDDRCTEDFEQHLRAALLARGLTDREADDFIAAWRPDVLAPPFSWHVLGLFGADAIDARFPLVLDPAPESMSRVLVFTVEGGGGW